MPKKFEDMTLEEKKEAFDKWQSLRSKAEESPAEYLTGSLAEALKPFIPEGVFDEAVEEIKDTLEDCFTHLEEAKE